MVKFANHTWGTPPTRVVLLPTPAVTFHNRSRRLLLKELWALRVLVLLGTLEIKGVGLPGIILLMALKVLLLLV